MKTNDTRILMGEAFDAIEYYQERCHEAERLLLEISSPWAFLNRFRRVKSHFARWHNVPMPKLIDIFGNTYDISNGPSSI